MPQQTAGASVASDQATIAQLEQQIAADGARAQSLVSRFNEVQARVEPARRADRGRRERRLAAAQRDEATAHQHMRRVAIKAYTTGSAGRAPPRCRCSAVRPTSTARSSRATTSGPWATSGTPRSRRCDLDQARTRDAESGLRSDQSSANKTLRELTSAHDAATAAIAAGEAKLDACERRPACAPGRRRQDACGRRTPRPNGLLAAAASAPVLPATPVSTVPVPDPTTVPPSTSPARPSHLPPSTPPPSGSGGYANPLRAVQILTPERIDQGVDYAGFGPLYAIGDGVVLNTVGSGWPGGTFIAYQLTDGPGAWARRVLGRGHRAERAGRTDGDDSTP